MDGADAERVEQPEELVLDDIGQRADDHQARFRRCVGGEAGHQRREAGILPLGEGRFDPAARIVEDPGRPAMLHRQPGRGAREVELDHLRRAGADEEQQLYVGPAQQHLVDDAVELVVAVRHPREIALLDDRGGEARLGNPTRSQAAIMPIAPAHCADVPSNAA